MNASIPAQSPQIFQGVLLLSDIDGTLFDRQRRIPPRNKEAISRFIDGGGLFAIASGRGPESVWPVARETKANCPCVTLNGAMLYDFQLSVPIYSWTLPDNFKALILRLRRDFPALGIQTYVGSHIYNVRDSEVVRNLFNLEKIEPKPLGRWIPLGEDMRLPDSRVNKLLFGGEPDLLAEVARALPEYTEEMASMRFLSSWTKYLEVLPADADKGTGALMLGRQCGIARERIAVVGDYYNDVEMLAAAGLSAVAGNAPDDLKETAGFVAGDCDEGAVADVIDHIERRLLDGTW